MRNGAATPIAIEGGPATVGALAANVGAQPQPAVVRFNYLRPGDGSWLELLPTIAHRLGLARGSYIGFLGAGALLLAVLAMLAVTAAVCWLLLRQAER